MDSKTRRVCTISKRDRTLAMYKLYMAQPMWPHGRVNCAKKRQQMYFVYVHLALSRVFREEVDHEYLLQVVFMTRK